MTLELEIARVGKLLRGYAIRLTRDATRAEDLIQDTILRALRYRSQFEPDTNIEAWMSTIMRNLYYDGAKKQRKHAEVEDPDGVLASLVLQPEPDRYEEQLELLQRVIPRMNGIQRGVLELLARGLGYAEISKRLDLNIGTVKSRVHRGKEEIIALLNEMEKVDVRKKLEKEFGGAAVGTLHVAPDHRNQSSVDDGRHPAIPPGEHGSMEKDDAKPG